MRASLSHFPNHSKKPVRSWPEDFSVRGAGWAYAPASVEGREPSLCCYMPSAVHYILTANYRVFINVIVTVIFTITYPIVWYTFSIPTTEIAVYKIVQKTSSNIKINYRGRDIQSIKLQQNSLK